MSFTTYVSIPIVTYKEKLTLMMFALIQHNRMQEVQLGSHTLRSHGVTVARTHMHDWLIFMLLIIIEIILLYVIHPFYRFVGKDMMSDLRYPLKDNTVPAWAVPVSFLLPLFCKYKFSFLIVIQASIFLYLQTDFFEYWTCDNIFVFCHFFLSFGGLDVCSSVAYRDISCGLYP